MLYLKKYFTEGLIQMAILLSLCGVKVDVGLQPYLPSSLHEVIMGPTSALPPTQFHNLYNRLHPKSVDLDGFFTARRLLGWAHSFDRLQVPPAEVETWLVQREPDPSPVRRLDQPSLRDIGGDRVALPVELQVRLGNQEEADSQAETQQAVHRSASLVDPREEELTRGAEEGGAPEGSTGHPDRALTGNEADPTSASLQECLRLLEETFTFTEVQQLEDVCDRRGSLEFQSSEGESFPCPHVPADTTSVDMELHWQDLLAIMGPENTNSAALPNSSGLDAPATETHLGSPFLQHRPRPGLQEDRSMSDGLPALLPLTPSAELDDHSSAQSMKAFLNSPAVDLSPPDHTDLLEESPSGVYSVGHHVENHSFSIDLSGMEPPAPPLLDADFYPRRPTPSRSAPCLVGNGGTQEFLASSPSVFLEDSDDVEDERDLPSPISALLEDATMLEEIRLLDLALEEGFGPEMAERSEEDYFGHDMENSEREEDRVGFTAEGWNQPGREEQDNKDEADSDSGLSLDFSHSPASPCLSDTSSYSSSSLSTSSSSCASTERLTETEETNSVGFDVDMEVTIKQEDLEEEEEVGAVGGGYPGDAEKLLSFKDEDRKVFEGFPWLQHVGHDHTYNQPWSTTSSPVRKSHLKHTKSAPAEHGAKPYFRSLPSRLSEAKLLSRDERRARYLKIPFSNELIVNLPVEEFNDLLAKHHFSEEQLSLIRDIRRRGKNKLAAQNCRKRKLDVLLSLEDSVSGLKRYRSQLLREKREALSSLQEMKRQLGLLYQQVFSRLRDETGRPLDAEEYLLQFGTNGRVLVAPRQQEGGAPQRGEKPSKKQKYKKK